MADFIKIHSADNVAVAISNVEAGDGHEYIPAGHKMALCDLPAEADVIKYGFSIGHLTKAVSKGDLIDHTNLKTNLEGLLEYSYQPELVEIVPAETPACFKASIASFTPVFIVSEIMIAPVYSPSQEIYTTVPLPVYSSTETFCFWIPTQTATLTVC